MKHRGREYFLVFVGLAGLLGATIALAFFDLGPWNDILALGISLAKTFLVAAFYMHLRESGGLVRLFAGAALLWLAILFGFTLADYATRPLLSPLGPPFLW